MCEHGNVRIGKIFLKYSIPHCGVLLVYSMSCGKMFDDMAKYFVNVEKYSTMSHGKWVW